MIDTEAFADDNQVDFIILVEHEYEPEFFEKRAEEMLGRNWKEEGLVLLKDEPETLEYFKNNYIGDQETPEFHDPMFDEEPIDGGDEEPT